MYRLRAADGSHHVIAEDRADEARGGAEAENEQTPEERQQAQNDEGSRPDSTPSGRTDAQISRQLAGQNARLFGFELGFSQDAGVTQCGQLLELGDAHRRGIGVERGRGRGRGRGRRRRGHLLLLQELL